MNLARRGTFYTILLMENEIGLLFEISLLYLLKIP